MVTDLCINSKLLILALIWGSISIAQVDNPVPKSGQEPENVDLEVSMIMNRFGGEMDDAIFRAIGHYSFGFNLYGDLKISISPNRLVIPNTKLSTKAQPIYTILDQVNPDLGIDTVLGHITKLGPNFGFAISPHMGTILSHFYNDKSPTAKPDIAVKTYVAMTDQDRKTYEQKLDPTWLDGALRTEKLGFEHIFSGLD